MLRKSNQIVALVTLTLAVVGCQAAGNLIDSISDTVKKIGGSVGSSLDDLASEASQPQQRAPRQGSAVPELPASVTGGRDLSSPVDGSYGTSVYDVDADDVDEDVEIFTDSDDVTYVAWSGDAASEDEEWCYLAWEGTENVDWMIITPCHDADGAIVCELIVDDEGYWNEGDCLACNVDGDCDPCPLEDDFCEWPEVDGPYEDDCEAFCLDLDECDLFDDDETIDDCIDLCDAEPDPALESCVESSDSCDEVEDCLDDDDDPEECDDFCVDLDDCDLLDDGETIDDCVDLCETDPDPELETCVESAGTCDDVELCLW